MSRKLPVGVVAAVLMACGGWLEGAQQPQEIEPRAGTVIGAAGEYLQQLESFRCECTGTLKFTLGTVR